MSRTIETFHISWHETCGCICRLDASVRSDKQLWNSDQCRYECKELIDKGRCDNESVQNPSSCECECDKLRDVGEYLDYENCKCRKRLIDKLVEKCYEDIDRNEMVYNATLYSYERVCKSCTLQIALLIVAFIIIMSIINHSVHNNYDRY